MCKREIPPHLMQDMNRSESHQVLNNMGSNFNSTTGKHGKNISFSRPASKHERGLYGSSNDYYMHIGESTAISVGPMATQSTKMNNSKSKSSIRDLNEDALKAFETVDNLGFQTIKSEAVTNAARQHSNFKSILDDLQEKTIQIQNEIKLNS